MDNGNPTEPQPQQNAVAKLHKGQNGWTGSGKLYRVMDNVIKIKNSDADRNHVPTDEQRVFAYDEQDNFSQHVLLAKSDETYQLWMAKIGPCLADWVLGKNPEASPPWRLIAFPDGYTLWLHKTGTRDDPGNPRTDAYLHGAPHLGPLTNRSQMSPTIFRSPMEFAEHAIWLMKGCVGQCLCKYCTPGQNQRHITRRLNRDRQVDSDSDDDDDDDDPNNGASRRRGAAGAQGRRPRRAKRDRSPAIMAKDYRVGGTA